MAIANNQIETNENKNKEKEVKQYIVVQIGSEKYGIDISYVDNIVRMQKITRVPKAQEYFKGIINLRGEIVPVMSIRLKMGLEDDTFTSASRIIILKIEDKGALGVIVDEVCEVVNLSEDQIENNNINSNHVKDTFINGIGTSGDQLRSFHQFYFRNIHINLFIDHACQRSCCISRSDISNFAQYVNIHFIYIIPCKIVHLFPPITMYSEA